MTMVTVAITTWACYCPHHVPGLVVRSQDPHNTLWKRASSLLPFYKLKKLRHGDVEGLA